MDLVIINLCNTGRNPDEGSLVFVGAQRMDAETGAVSASLRTFVRPEPTHIGDFAEWFGPDELRDDDLNCLPSAGEALMDLSRLAGDDVIIAHLGNLVTVPQIRHQCERLGIPTRQVRFVDSSVLARELLGEDIRNGLRDLARHFGVLQGNPPPFGPFGYLQVLRMVVLRLWALRSQEEGVSPTFVDAAVLPDISPQVECATPSI